MLWALIKDNRALLAGPTEGKAGKFNGLIPATPCVTEVVANLSPLGVE